MDGSSQTQFLAKKLHAHVVLPIVDLCLLGKIREKSGLPVGSPPYRQDGCRSLIHDGACHRSRVPVLAIAAHVARSAPAISRGRIRNSCSRNAAIIASLFAADRMPRKLEIAIREAVANRGVSVVVLPGDVALQRAFEAPLPEVSSLLPSQPIVTPDSEVLGRLAALLDGESRVTMLCGWAHDQLMALGKRLKAPIVHPSRERSMSSGKILMMLA